MTTKTNSKITTEIIAVAAPAAPAVSATPAQHAVIVITEPTATAFAAAAVLIRSGWMVCPDATPVMYSSTSHSTITLVRGNPDAHATAIAEAAEAYAVTMHQIDFQKEVDLAAKRMIAQAAKDAADVARAVLLAEQKAALAKLEAEQKAALSE